jgi:hypothetical protein
MQVAAVWANTQQTCAVLLNGGAPAVTDFQQ